MKPLQGNMSPESIVIVHSAHGNHCWVLEPEETIQDVYAYYAKEFPDFKIRVFFCGVQSHERPIEEVPIEKLKWSKSYIRPTDRIYSSEKLEHERLLKRPIWIDDKYEVQDGWQRVMMAHRDGWKTIPCVMRAR